MASNALKNLLAAIAASGLSDRRYAKENLGVNERTLRRWKAGKPMPRWLVMRYADRLPRPGETGYLQARKEGLVK